jgi:lysophospholipase L1-like esterase
MRVDTSKLSLNAPKSWTVACACLLTAIFSSAPTRVFAAPALPTIWIAGDSTAAEGTPEAVGWGKPFAALFDPARINIENAARGGRSSRTFITGGDWDRMIANVQPGDYVLIQFGHNDGGPVNADRARGSLPGLGDQVEEIENILTKRHETVHSFGWYMRKMIADTRARGAMPILLSLTVRNIWNQGSVERGSGNYGEWTRQLAVAERLAFIDLTTLAADRYEQMGQEAVKALFPRDHTHTSTEGAALNAQMVVAGLKALRENALLRGLSPAGHAVAVAPPSIILPGALVRPPYADRAAFLHWLNLPEPAKPELPRLFLIGDSTVRNGRGDAVDGQWGWGDPLAAYFDPAKVNLVNRAVGGTGARTFLAQGYWALVLAMLKPGDVVIMQFGHNDNGATGSLKGIGEEAEERENGGVRDTVHTFGWYLRKYIAETRAQGAIPVLCTLVPRNIWQEGRIARPADSHADWTRAVARAENVPLLDLNELIASRYDRMGEAEVTPLFADQRVHTTRAGAELTAAVVMSALHMLRENPVKDFERPVPATIW